jgi:uncharacterized protein (TIGR02145 family)
MILNFRRIKILAMLSAILIFGMCSKENPDPDMKPQTITDIDGNTYMVVKIGTQTWMAENLNVTHYNNGDPILNIIGTQWDEQVAGAYCAYDNNSDKQAVYGLLYNWHAVNDSRKLCPDGWHIASIDEWGTLASSGTELKEQGTSHWITPNNCSSQFSGFNGLPGGNAGYDGGYYSMGEFGCWWTSSEDDVNNAWNSLMTNNNTGLSGWVNADKWIGASIRCIEN